MIQALVIAAALVAIIGALWWEMRGRHGHR